ncbi:DNA replication complex GINS protein Sld5 [Brevipalpus obovatus]|uniref:DNA replication complex GINS protein Sld5 n=1 Tax=Brevipalpus obovatus TaxID=246614 RepID=UPI003D9F1D5B
MDITDDFMSQGPSRGTQEEVKLDSIQDVYKRLMEVVNNESLVDQLLPYEEDVIDHILGQVDHMSETIKDIGPSLGSFCVEQHKIELERISFLVNKYFRIRLAKIETRATDLVKLLRSDLSKAEELLSQLEIKYLDKYVTSLDNYFDATVLEQLPRHLQTFRMRYIPTDPMRDEFDYYFMKAKKNLRLYLKDPITKISADEEQVSQNDRKLMPFSAIEPHFGPDKDRISIL